MEQPHDGSSSQQQQLLPQELQREEQDHRGQPPQPQTQHRSHTQPPLTADRPSLPSTPQGLQQQPQNEPQGQPEEHHHPQGQQREERRPQRGEEDSQRVNQSQRKGPSLGLHRGTRSRGRRSKQSHPYHLPPWHRRGLHSLSDYLLRRKLGRHLYAHRLTQFNSAMHSLLRFAGPDALEGRRFILHVGLGFLLLAKDTEEAFQELGALGQHDSFLSGEISEDNLMSALLRELNQTEERLAARRRTRERPDSEQPSGRNVSRPGTARGGSHVSPLSRNCCNPQQQQQQQQQPQQEENDGQENQQPLDNSGVRKLTRQRMRQCQYTISQLQQLHVYNPDDTDSQLVYLYVALAQIHLLERDLSPPGQGRSQSGFSEKARILEEIYRCELR